MVEKEWLIKKLQKHYPDLKRNDILFFYDFCQELIRLVEKLRFVDPKLEFDIYEKIIDVSVKQTSILVLMSQKKSELFQDAEEKENVDIFVETIKKEEDLQIKLKDVSLTSDQKNALNAELGKVIAQRADVYKYMLSYTDKERAEVRKRGWEEAKKMMCNHYSAKKFLITVGAIAGGAYSLYKGISYLNKKKKENKKA